MGNGLYLYSAFIQSALQFMPLIHPFTHQERLAAMQGTNQLVRSNWGLGVLLRDTSTCPGWDRTGNPPTARLASWAISPQLINSRKLIKLMPACTCMWNLIVQFLYCHNSGCYFFQRNQSVLFPMYSMYVDALCPLSGCRIRRGVWEDHSAFPWGRLGWDSFPPGGGDGE